MGPAQKDATHPTLFREGHLHLSVTNTRSGLGNNYFHGLAERSIWWALKIQSPPYNSINS
ncbi:MAG TPA: hypothetical protein ENF37_03080 [Beggiatoa sp.]|nr:hypothetical protein [Beggiatoa sp.]